MTVINKPKKTFLKKTLINISSAAMVASSEPNSDPPRADSTIPIGK